jgi:glycosyltransferase involved in cell wall biosynthesis
MKVLHIGLVGPANEEMSYQGAVLPRENKKAGHDVTVISGCYKWDQNKIVKVPEEDMVKDGIRYIRIAYDKIINETITEKIRKSSKLIKYLEVIKPDAILHHDLQTYELLTVAKYKKRHPDVILYADSHTDHNNSANSWASLNILHKVFYKFIIMRALPYIKKVLYISYETKDFLMQMYKIKDDFLEFYPLGGSIFSKEDKISYRNLKRDELHIKDDEILICHSGKMDYLKKTFELLDNFAKVKDDRLHMIIIGTFTSDIEEKVKPFIESDSRIHYLGWKNSDELIKYIAASDLYMQPGSQSATMQTALCSGTPVLFKNMKSHEAYMQGNAFVIDEYSEIKMILQKICERPEILKEMSEKAYDIAYRLLDYKKQAERILR